MASRMYWCELWQNKKGHEPRKADSFDDLLDPGYGPGVLDRLAEAITRNHGKESDILQYRLKVYDSRDGDLILDYPGSATGLKALRSGKLPASAPPGAHSLAAFTDDQLLGELRRRLRSR